MAESSIVTRSFVIAVLVLLTLISVLNIVSTDAQPLLKAAWSVSVFLVSVALALTITLRKRAVAIILISVAAALALFALLLRGNVIQYCGDEICTLKECGEQCADCSVKQCENRVCETPLERCDTADDCRCEFGMACAPNRKSNTSVIDERGCAPVACGDGFCDHPESTNNCCDDCGCPTEHRCEQHACYFNPPRIDVKSRMLTRSIGVTSLVGNHLLTNESGDPRPIFGMMLKSSGYLKDVRINFSIGQLHRHTEYLGDVAPNAERPVLWYMRRDPSLLALDHDVDLNLTVRATYTDVKGDNRSSVWIYPMTVYGRDKLDEYGSVVLFVTHDYRPIAKTPDGIWNALGKIVAYDSTEERAEDRIRFPSETLARGKGSRSDIAVLIAGAYDAANLSPSLVEGPVLDGGHGLYVRVRSGNRYLILDPTLIGNPFSEAAVQRPGYAVWDIPKVRYERNLSIISFNASKSQ